MALIRAELAGSDIYVMLDETQDELENKVVNILVGKLNGKLEKAILVKTEFVEACNAIVMGKLFNRTLNELFPGEDFYDRVKLVITDGAPYMKLTFENQKKTLYPNMIYVTCIVHMIHRVAERIKEKNNLLNSFIANMKALLVKSGKRQDSFKEHTALKLPPKAIPTRWGSWISVALYYHDNFGIIEGFLKKLIEKKKVKKAEKSKALEELESIINTDNPNYAAFKNQIEHIEKFRNIPEILTKLEDPKLSLKEQLAHLESAQIEFSSCPVARMKMGQVIAKNTGLQKMKEGEKEIAFGIKMKYAPLTSCECERSFSQYKNFLRLNRLSFTEENIKYHHLISYNKFLMSF